MYQLIPQIRHYSWGSRDVLAELTGRHSPTAEPEAELWVGAHPEASATMVGSGPTRGLTLEQLIQADPTRMLGTDYARRFGDRLPFLLKVLAVEGALSIQCHPAPPRSRPPPRVSTPIDGVSRRRS